MKKAKFFLGFLMLPFLVQAQTWSLIDSAAVDSVRASVFNYKVPFFVPDNPAFKALDIDPSNVLQPTDIKSFALMLSPYVSSQGLALPQNFALEFSPGRVASKNWTYAQYDSSAWKRFCYHFSFNAATRFDQQENSDPFKVALGLHYQFVPRKSDPVRNSGLYTQTKISIINKAPLINAYIIAKHLPPDTRVAIYSPTGDSAAYKSFLAWVNSPALPDSLAANVKKMKDLSFDNRLKQYQADHWNDPKFNLAAVWVGQAQDSTLKGVGYNMVNVWASAAFRPCKKSKHAQVLLGLFYRNSIHIDTLGALQTFTGNGRFYYGDAKVRGFVEAQYKWMAFRNQEPATTQSLLVNFGLEAKITDKFGVFASTGIENFFEPGIKPWSKLRSGLDLRYYFD
jgi:hypothetical protein